MNPIFLSVRVPAKGKKGNGSALVEYIIQGNVQIRKVTFVVRTTVPTKDTAPFVGGLKARLDGMEKNAMLDVAIIDRLPSKTLELMTPLYHSKGKHVMVFENESTHHVNVDIILDGTDPR